MPDADRRQLERDASQGDVEAAASLLRERLRTGELTEHALRLAAYLGDPAARSAAQASEQFDALRELLAHANQRKSVDPTLEVWGDSPAFCFGLGLGLGLWGRVACVGVPLHGLRQHGAAIAALPDVESADVLGLIAASEAWLTTPSKTTLKAAKGAWERSNRDARRRDPEWTPSPLSIAAESVCRSVFGRGPHLTAGRATEALNVTACPEAVAWVYERTANGERWEHEEPRGPLQKLRSWFGG